MTKRIGIPGWMVGENSFGVSVSYMEFIYKFGKPIVLSPIDAADPPEIDMLLAPGGVDILPTSYKAMPGFRTQKSSPLLEHFDAQILPQYIERKTPIFAICRGMQRIWAMYGGAIEQNNVWHGQSKNPFEQCHELHFAEGHYKMSSSIKKVTSRHHQCADSSIYTPDELEVLAYAKEGNQWFPSVVEIFRHKTLPIFCVQFHPEDHDDTDKLSSSVIREYLNIS
jgi:putative glutamine amidotransferase